MANTFNPLQAQAFSLAGSGAVIGATSLTLKSMTTIDGALVTMAMLGSYAFITLEPGNGTNEEQIKFTGITQNANGTATLTGVSNVSFGTPYTVTSGILKTHAGSVTAILSNTSGFYNSFVAKDDDGTISEVLTFTQPNFPQMDGIGTPPTAPAQLATKHYVDTVVTGGAPNASATAIGITKLSVSPVSPTNPVALGQNDPILTTQSGNALTGTTNKVVDSLSPITSGTATKAATSGSQTIAHGLGRIPKRVDIVATGQSPLTTYSEGTWTSSSQNCIFVLVGTGPGALLVANYVVSIGSGSSTMVATVASVDATNITLTWTAAGSGVATALNWTAQ